MSRSSSRTWLRPLAAALLAAVWGPSAACAQSGTQRAPGRGEGATTQGKPAAPSTSGSMADHDHMVGMADHAMSGGMSMDSTMSLHMELTPPRLATSEDSAKARAVVAELRQAIAKYKDVSVAEREGFRMFLPNVKNQRVYHFTNYRNAFKEAFRFDAEQPTSLLYKRAPDGELVLVGAMYTMPKRASVDRLNERVPLSIARWHKHVNWCLPPKGAAERYAEQRDGHPVFGPESRVATKAACDAVGGNFYESLFGWMLHANVYAGDDLGTIFGDEHGRR